MAGVIKDELRVDATFFRGVRAQLEKALGLVDYHSALAEGARRPFAETVAEALVATT